MCGELLVCDGSIFNFPSIIEWNYQQHNTTIASGTNQNKKRKKNFENLQKISNKYKGQDKKEERSKKIFDLKPNF